VKAWLAGHRQRLVKASLAAACFVLGMALGAGVVFYLYKTHRLGESAPRTIAASSPVKVDQARELAARGRAKAVGELTITAHDGPDATTIVGNATTRTQILARARQGDEVVEARFTHVTPADGRPGAVTAG
jgi:hypothetical protein